MNDALLNAYRFHRSTTRAARRWSRPSPNPAWDALHLARRDALDGKIRHGAYDAPSCGRLDDGMSYFSDPAAFGLRLVGRVQSEPWRHGNRTWSENGGWFTDPYGDVFKDGSGLCYGLVYQLPGKDGKARFVAGYEHGGVEGGPTIDLSRIFESDPEEAGPFDTNAADRLMAKDAACHADTMAKDAAEEERNYQTAYQAGSQYADKKGDAEVIRKHALALGRERRAAKGAEGFPTICETIRGAISNARDKIGKLRAEMRKLAQGDGGEYLSFWPGDKRLKEAFNEGAGERVLS